MSADTERAISIAAFPSGDYRATGPAGHVLISHVMVMHKPAGLPSSGYVPAPWWSVVDGISATLVAASADLSVIATAVVAHLTGQAIPTFDGADMDGQGIRRGDRS